MPNDPMMMPHMPTTAPTPPMYMSSNDLDAASDSDTSDDDDGEERGDLLMTKDKLLAVGDKHEEQLRADRAVETRYR